jgi:hypothetical protein
LEPLTTFSVSIAAREQERATMTARNIQADIDNNDFSAPEQRPNRDILFLPLYLVTSVKIQGTGK